ncbi:unnamed protein product [Symbiodinium microadriaticum]|nr:unnamed protein product [Symbiodinium microadriaticum]
MSDRVSLELDVDSLTEALDHLHLATDSLSRALSTAEPCPSEEWIVVQDDALRESPGLHPSLQFVVCFLPSRERACPDPTPPISVRNRMTSPAETLAFASAGLSGDAEAMFGPSTVLTVPAMEEQEDGAEVATESSIEVLVVDFSDATAAYLEPFDPLSLEDPVPFSEEGERIAFYSAQEGEDEALEPADPVEAPAAAAKAKEKRVTTAQLAEQLGSISKLLPAISDRLQDLAERQKDLETKVTAQSSAPPPPAGPAHKQPFALPTSKAPQVAANPTQALVSALGPPPRSRPLALGAAPEPPLPLPAPPDDEGGQDATTASALAQQTAALTQLVSHLIQASDGSGDFVGAPAPSGLSSRASAKRERLQAELAQRTGNFMLAEPRRFLFSHYLPRGLPAPAGLGPYHAYGHPGGRPPDGRRGGGQFGLTSPYHGLPRTDHGKFEVGFTLSLFAEPPHQIFTNRGSPHNPRLRAFAPLCPAAWATTALAFLKETDVILSRRGTFAFPAPSKTLFPLPLPYFGLFNGTSPQPRSSAARAKLGVRRVLFVTVAALNYLHAGSRPVCLLSLRRPPSSTQAKALDYLGRLVKASGGPEDGKPFSVSLPSASRRSSQLIARLEELSEQLTWSGSSFDKYGRAFAPLTPDAARDALNPYRSLDPSRLVLAGRANWDPSEFLDDLFYLPFREPQSILLPEVPPPGPGEVPDLTREDPASVLGLCQLWDSKSLLRLSKSGPAGPHQGVRIFSAVKSAVTDRQIGDRRGRNRCEGVLAGPSGPLPSGPLLGGLCIDPRRHTLSIAITDRRDFYHQLAVPPRRALRNVLVPCLEATRLQSLKAFSQLALLEDTPSGIGQADGRQHKLYPAFAAVLQGDALGVEFATSAHSNLLSSWGLLGEEERLQSNSALSGAGGAELDSSPYTRGLGLAARPTHTTDVLHLCLVGGWVSGFMYRRPFMSVFGRVFRFVEASAVVPEHPKMLPLPRRVADELVLAAALSHVLVSDMSASWASEVFATDSSDCKGAIVSAPVGPEVTAALWRACPKAAGSARLLSKEEAVLRRVWPDREEPAPQQTHRASPKRPPACRFHFLEIWGASCPISPLLAALGWTVGPRLDPAVSLEYDLCSRRVFEWIAFLLERGRVDALGASLPLATFSPAARLPLRTPTPAGFLDFCASASKTWRYWHLAPDPDGGIRDAVVREVRKAWAWPRPVHINILEASCVYRLVCALAKQSGPLRVVSLCDSNVAKCAITKGRSPPCCVGSQPSAPPSAFPATWSFVRLALCRPTTRAATALFPSPFLARFGSPTSLVCCVPLLAFLLSVGGLRGGSASFLDWVSPSLGPVGTMMPAGLSVLSCPRLWTLTGPLVFLAKAQPALLLPGSVSGNAGDLWRKSRRGSDDLPAGRLVEASTQKQRDALWNAFAKWLEDQGISAEALVQPPGSSDVDSVNCILTRYGRELYKAGRPYAHYSELINAYSSKVPKLRRLLQPAWDLAFSWKRAEPGRHHTAMPWQVLLGLVTTAFLWGWPRTAGLLALSWGGLLRIGEALAARRSDLMFPRDVWNTIDFAYLSIREPKTRYSAARHQSVRIDQPNVLRIVTVAFQALGPAEKLWPSSAQTLRTRFRQLCGALQQLPWGSGSKTPGLELASLRAGGATWLLMADEDSELVRRRGRWLTSKIMEIYIQEVSSIQFLPSLKAETKRLVRAALEAHEDVVRKAEFFTATGILPDMWYRLFSARTVAVDETGVLGGAVESCEAERGFEL